MSSHGSDVLTVHVFHNLGAFSGIRPSSYLPGDHVVEVFQTTASSGTPMQVCEDMFELLNVGDDPDFGTPDPRAVAYRARRNRSLSIGDVVAVDGTFYACAPSGFIPIAPPYITTAGLPGSTPHTDPDLPPTTERPFPLSTGSAREATPA
jgi:hypothetical protein